MKRVFGRKKTAEPVVPAVSLEEMSATLGKRGETIDDQIQKAEIELLQLRKQATTVKGPSSTRLRQKALVVLKRKRMYEKQRDQLYATQFKIHQTQFASEQIQTSITTAECLQQAATNLKSEIMKIDIDRLEAAHDDLRDLIFDTEEVNEILERCYHVPDDIDENELDEEFAALEVELEAEVPNHAEATLVPSYIPQTVDDIPSAPIQELPNEFRDKTSNIRSI